MTKQNAQTKVNPIFGLQSGATYPGSTSNVIRRSFTIAALVASGYGNVSAKTGLFTKRKSGDLAKFRAITAGKADRVWKKPLQDDSYAAKAQQALKGAAANGYNGQLDIIQKIVKALDKGGQVKVKDDSGREETIKLVKVSG